MILWILTLIVLILLTARAHIHLEYGYRTFWGIVLILFLVGSTALYAIESTLSGVS